jgi:hypothetical protein
MPAPFIWDLDHVSRKCANYWQSVLLFGLPLTVLYASIDYAAFRVTAGRLGLQYPWRVEAIGDVGLMFLASTIWWGLMRQLVAWKRKSQPQ